MNQVALFDYGGLDAETREAVVEHTAAIHERIQRSGRDIIEIGEHLTAVKDQFPHGQFLAWLDAEFQWSERTAYNFMQVAECFKLAKFANLPKPSVLYAIAAPSTPQSVRDEVLERVAEGEKVSVAEAQALIDRAKDAAQRGLTLEYGSPRCVECAAIEGTEHDMYCSMAGRAGALCEDCGAWCREAMFVGDDALCDACAEQRYKPDTIDSVQTVLGAAGDDDGAWERARQIAYYSKRVAAASELIILDPQAIADLLDEGRRISTRSFCSAMSQWCAALTAAMDRPVHLVSGERIDE